MDSGPSTAVKRHFLGVKIWREEGLLILHTRKLLCLELNFLNFSDKGSSIFFHLRSIKCLSTAYTPQVQMCFHVDPSPSNTNWEDGQRFFFCRNTSLCSLFTVYYGGTLSTRWSSLATGSVWLHFQAQVSRADRFSAASTADMSDIWCVMRGPARRRGRTRCCCELGWKTLGSPWKIHTFCLSKAETPLYNPGWGHFHLTADVDTV